MLLKRKNENTFRSLKTSTGLIDFFSNDYLGFARSEELFDKINQTITAHPHFNGATGSRLLSGNSELNEQVEKTLANFFKAASCLIFNSGYSANVGVLSSLPQRGDTILYDELAHASIKDGARLSLAKRFSFRHNDLEDLEKKLRVASGHCYVVVESVYSMDGDICPLTALVNLGEKYNASIVLDEAHSTGVFGTNGNGLANQLNVQDKIAVRIYTFGKAAGCHGACVAGSTLLKQFLVNFARPFIYTTALPPHSLIAIDSAIQMMAENSGLQKLLFDKIELFNKVLNRAVTPSPIQSFTLGDAIRAKKIETVLTSDGFDVRAIVSPTVRVGTERLRICLHTFNTDEEITHLASSISKFSK